MFFINEVYVEFKNKLMMVTKNSGSYIFIRILVVNMFLFFFNILFSNAQTVNLYCTSNALVYPEKDQIHCIGADPKNSPFIFKFNSNYLGINEIYTKISNINGTLEIQNHPTWACYSNSNFTGEFNLNTLNYGRLYEINIFMNNEYWTDLPGFYYITNYNISGSIQVGISPPSPQGIKFKNGNEIPYFVEGDTVKLKIVNQYVEGDTMFRHRIKNSDDDIFIDPDSFIVPSYSGDNIENIQLHAYTYNNEIQDLSLITYSPIYTQTFEVRPRLLTYKYSDTTCSNENETYAHFTVGALGQNDSIFLTTTYNDNGVIQNLEIGKIAYANSNNNDYKVRIPVTCNTIKVKHTIIDANGETQEFAIYKIQLNNIQLQNPTLNIKSYTDTLTCFGDSNGQITLEATAGASTNFTFKCNGTNNKTGLFNNLTSGDYQVYVVDSLGCKSDIDSITINQPKELTLSAIPKNITCHGYNNGEVTLKAEGGIGKYSYSKDALTWQDANTFNGLRDSTYKFYVKDTNMCTSNVVVTITQPSAISGSIKAQTNVLCHGGNNGSVTVSGSGGTPPYMYRINGGTYQASGTFNGLAAGSHTITVRDANGCTSNMPVTITQPASAVSGSIVAQTNVSCYGGNNGSVTVSGSGGTPPYTFTKDGWSTTAGPTYNTYTFSGLSKGYYNLVGKDANGCNITLPQVNITSPSQLVLENIATTHNRCFSGSEGVISIKASGGTAPYSYTVDNGLSWSADSVFSGLTAGNYYARVKDSLGCTINPTLVSITQPADSFVLAVDTFKNVSCFGGNDGEVSVYVALGGHPPFTYSSDGINWQPERVFNQLTAGVGYLYATDSSGCTVKVKNPITQPEPISATVTPYHVACKGASTGKIVLSIAGGVGSYQVTLLSNGKTVGSKGGIAKTAEYSDLPAGTYDLTIIDSNGCTKEINGIVIAEPANMLDFLPFSVSQPSCFGYSNGQVDADASGGWGGYRYTLLGFENNNGVFSGLKAGAYSIEVADSVGCKVQKWFTIGEPDPLTLDVKVSDVQCYGGNDGRAEVTATGGTPQYSFDITGNEIFHKGTNSELSVMENLTAGNYTIWLYDSHGCSTSKPITISQPPKLQVFQNNFNSGATNKTCTDTVRILTAGGVGPYTIQFPDSAAIDCPTSGYLLHSLPNGRYPFRINDSHGCTVDDTASISNLPPPTLELVEVVNASCSNSVDGSITVQAFSSTNWVEVKWSNGATGSQLVGVPGGSYTAVATDLYGCTYAETFEISKPDTLVVNSASIRIPTCNGGTDGGIRVVVTGGTQPYSYEWSNGVRADSTGSIPAGSYTLTISDSKGCKAAGQFTVTEPPSLQPLLPRLVTLCTNQSYLADAGVPGSQFLWFSPNGFTATTAKVELKTPGDYYLVVTNSMGCVGRDTIRIESYGSIIDADFLIPDKASVNDTIVLIEMSWPIPEAIQWFYPADAFAEVYRNQYSLYLTPLKVGSFNIGLMTYTGPCNQYIEKIIAIGPSKELHNSPNYLSPFKNIAAFPNPSNGHFDVLVEMNGQGDIIVEVFSMYGQRVLFRELQGQSVYRVSAAINPIPGMYLIRITSSNHTQNLRIVVQ